MEINLREIAEKNYYINKDIIKYLLIENLTLKNILFEKGIFTLEDFKNSQYESKVIFEDKVDKQIEEYLEANSEVFSQIQK